MGTQNDYSIILINLNTRYLLEDSLKRIGSDKNIIVVDNGSTDGSVELIHKKYPAVTLIQNKYNLGFAKAANQALNIVKTKAALLLNTDIKIDLDQIRQLYAFINKDKKTALVSPLLLNEDGSVQETVSFIPNLFHFISGYKPNRNKRFKDIDKRVYAVRGACMMFRTDAVKAVGCFDESFFLFLEETDLCKKLTDFGWDIKVAKDIKVCHLLGQSATDKSDSRIEYWRSRYIFINKHYKIPYFILWIIGTVKSLLTYIAKVGEYCIKKVFLNKNSNKIKQSMYILFWHCLYLPETWGIRSSSYIKDKKSYRLSGKPVLYSQIKGKKIKDTTERTVYKSGKDLIKLYKKKPKRSKKEFFILDTLCKKGLNVPRPQGYSYFNKPAILATDYIYGSTIDKIIEKKWDELSVEKRYRMLKNFSSFIVSIFRTGLYHKDFHAGNVIFDDNTETFYLTDFHRSRICHKLTKRNIIKMLIQLDMYFSLMFDRRYRILSFKYIWQNIYPHLNYKDILADMDKELQVKRMILWDNRKKKFYKEKYGKKISYCGNEFLIDLTFYIKNKNKIDQFLKATRDVETIIKNSSSTFAAIFHYRNRKYFIKRFRNKNIWKTIKNIFRRPIAYKAWYGAQDIIQRRLNTPRPLLAYRGSSISKKNSFIVTEYIDSDNLSIWIFKHYFKMSSAEKQEFNKKLYNFVKNMHERGIVPLDLKGSNILVDGDMFYVVDTHGLANPLQSRYCKKKNYIQIKKTFDRQKWKER